MDPVGFEPTAFSMPLRRAPNCAMGPFRLKKYGTPAFSRRPIVPEFQAFMQVFVKLIRTDSRQACSGERLGKIKELETIITTGTAEHPPLD